MVRASVAFVLSLALAGCFIPPESERSDDDDDDGSSPGGVMSSGRGPFAGVVDEHSPRADDDASSSTAADAEDDEGPRPLVQPTPPTIISGQMTISISTDDGCDGLAVALGNVGTAILAPSAHVAIVLDAGEYVCEHRLDVANPWAAPLEVRGATGAANDVVLTFPSQTPAIRIASGSATFSDLTLRTTQATSRAGVELDRSGVSASLEDLVVEGFAVGVSVRDGASASVSGAVARDNGVGFLVENGGALRITNAIAEGNASSGFAANAGGHLSVFTSEARNNGEHGFFSNRGSTTNTADCTATGNGSSGFAASFLGFLAADRSTSTGNSAYGFEVRDGGFLRKVAATDQTDNALGPDSLEINTMNALDGSTSYVR